MDVQDLVVIGGGAGGLVVYACGDVAGPFRFTHMAEYQAGVVLSNAVFRLPKKVDYRQVPWATFTDPELAHIGLTEARARSFALRVRGHRSRPVRARAARASQTHRPPWSSARRLRSRPAGGELLHEIALAMRTGARLRDIADTIHIYPTLAQIHRRAVSRHYGPRLYSPAVKTAVRWLQRWLP